MRVFLTIFFKSACVPYTYIDLLSIYTITRGLSVCHNTKTWEFGQIDIDMFINVAHFIGFFFF